MRNLHMPCHENVDGTTLFPLPAKAFNIDQKKNFVASVSLDRATRTQSYIQPLHLFFAATCIRCVFPLLLIFFGLFLKLFSGPNI